MVQDFDWVHEHAAKLAPALRWRLAEARSPRGAVAAFIGPPLAAGPALQVLLQFDRDAGDAAAQEIRALVRRGRGRVRRSLPRFAAMAVATPVARLAELVRHPAVRYVSEDYRVHATLDVATPTVAATGLWDEGLTGAGATIAIVDTGCHPHPDLTRPKRRIVAFRDLVRGRRRAYDDNGHGTHCAGDAAGNGTESRGTFRGPAPEAKVVAVKALDRYGSGTASTILAGIDWVIENQARLNIRVLSLSLGGQPSGRPEDDPLVQGVETAWRAGIVVCAAAGNDGPHPGTVGTPGIAPSIITVGASDDHGTTEPWDDSIAEFSSRGPTPDGHAKPDVVAPGTRITSLLAPGSALAGGSAGSPPGYLTLSGTSMATPIVAGVVAQILQARPEATPDDVKEALVATAHSLGQPAEAQGAGLIDARAALAWLRDHGGGNAPS